METDLIKRLSTLRAGSPDTLFKNDFSDSEEENEVDKRSENSEPFTSIEGIPSDKYVNTVDDAKKMTIVSRDVENDGILPPLIQTDTAGEHDPDQLDDGIKLRTDDVNSKQDKDEAEQTSHNRDVNIDPFATEWKLQKDDLLCLPLVLNEIVAFDGQFTSLERYKPAQESKGYTKRFQRKKSSKGSMRMVYVSPMTMIAKFAKKSGYDLPTFMETSELYGGPSLTLPCMQCYEKYGGRTSAGMDYMSDTYSGKESGSNDKCSTCGGKVQTIASFGRMIRQMRQTLEAKGLVPHDVYPDGNCLFAAVVDQLRVCGDFSFTTHSLRQSAVNYLRQNPTADDGTPLEMFLTDDESWETYLARMSEEGEWGDHIILSALTNVINKPIVIYGGTSGQEETILNPKSRSSDKVESEENNLPSGGDSVVYLGHVSESHYMSLRPKKWRQELQEGLHQRKKLLSDSTRSKEKLTKCPLKHINFILRQVYRMEFIYDSKMELLDVIVPSRLENPDSVMEMFGSTICKLTPSKINIDKYGPDISIFFPSVKEEEDIHGCFEAQECTVFNTPNDTEILSTITAAKATDLIADNNAGIKGHLKLIPNRPKLWEGQTTLSQDRITYLNTFEVDFDKYDDISPSKSSKEGITVPVIIAFKCTWPDILKHWECRYRKSGFPDEHTIRAVVENGCHVIPLTLDYRLSDIFDDPIHFMTSVDDQTWCYSFAAAEKEICRFLSDEQRQSFLIFKILVAMTLKDIPLPVSVVKSVFFHSCERIEKSSWRSRPGECLLILLKKLKECLKNGNLPHYFIDEKNLLYCIPKKVVEECYLRLDSVTLQPIVALYFVFDQLNVMSSEIGSFIEDVIGSTKEDAHFSVTGTDASQSLLPVCTELTKDLINQEDYQAALLVLQDVVEEQGNTLETDGVELLKKVMWDSHIGHLWCFALYVDIKRKTSLSRQVCKGYSTVHVTEVFGPECTEELPDTLVPECFSIIEGDLIFADKVSDILRQAASGKMFIKCMKYYLKTYGELAGDSLILQLPNHVTSSLFMSGMDRNRMKDTLSLASSSSTLLYSLQNLYAGLFNFCNQSNMVEEFRELVPLYALIAESLDTRTSLTNLAYMWRCLGEDKKAADARRKLGGRKGESTFNKMYVILKDYELD